MSLLSGHLPHILYWSFPPLQIMNLGLGDSYWYVSLLCSLILPTAHCEICHSCSSAFVVVGLVLLRLLARALVALATHPPPHKLLEVDPRHLLPRHLLASAPHQPSMLASHHSL